MPPSGMLRSVSLVITNVSEERITSIIRVIPSISSQLASVASYC
jgi:hypothetical protein